MAGTFPGTAGCCQIDQNGKPLQNGKLYVYAGGTTAPSNTFQDIGLIIPAENPLQLDLTGRVPLFFVADGTYHVRLIDQFGVQQFNYPQIPSIGASSSGGGGTPVDPTTVFQTGDPLWLPRSGIRAGWVRMNARTIGSSTSGSTERANADCQNLFLELWNDYPDAKCPVVGGRGVSAAADWTANKQITVPDMRGKGPFGLDGMGNTRANVIPDGNVQGGDTGDTADARVGTTTHAVAQANLPAVAPTFTGTLGTATTGVNVPQAGAITPELGQGTGGTGNNIWKQGTFAPLNSSFTPAGTISNLGSGTALETISPGVLGTWYCKL